jgi:hypothetical protein
MWASPFLSITTKSIRPIKNLIPFFSLSRVPRAAGSVTNTKSSPKVSCKDYLNVLKYSIASLI